MVVWGCLALWWCLAHFCLSLYCLCIFYYNNNNDIYYSCLQCDYFFLEITLPSKMSTANQIEIE